MTTFGIEQRKEVMGNLLQIALAPLIFATVGALLLQFGARVITELPIKYGICWITSFLHQLTLLIVIFFSGFFSELMRSGDGNLTTSQIVTITFASLLTLFLSQSAITYAIINYTNKTYKNALKIMGIVYGLILVFTIVITICWFLIYIANN